MIALERGITAVDAIDPNGIATCLEQAALPEKSRVRGILARARTLEGLTQGEAAVLTAVTEPELLHELFDAARFVKNEIYGRRLVLFAPLYYSSFCRNNCLYCGFRRENAQPRRRLELAEVAAETRTLIDQGHKRVLVIAGEEGTAGAFSYLLDVLATVYEQKTDRGEIRRVNLETAPMTIPQFRELKAARIGTYVVFQETYHPEVYRRMHPGGPKADYRWRLETMDRAMEAGIDDVGIGALFGLHDWRFEVLALLAHARHLDARYGAGPHTISVPRIEPAPGAPAALNPPNPVSDADFRKLVAILRLAVPYTGIILSTRESADLRRELFDLGVSQLSAGSRTSPGGYHEHVGGDSATLQFSVNDNRGLDEVVADIAAHGYIPSFCTGCYRTGRTGHDFMELAKPGLIRDRCLPNALLTFQEYLLDCATPGTREIGERVIEEALAGEIPAGERPMIRDALERIRQGYRDLFL